MFSSIISLYLGSLLASQPAGSAITETENTQVAAQHSENLSVSPIPKKIQEGSPQIQANAAIIIDLRTGEILWGKNMDEKRPIGSITKLMTSLVVLEENSQNEIAKVTQNASGIGGSKIWIAAGEKLAVQDLIFAALIHSANDAAFALAEFNSNGDIKKFVEKMNQKAKVLGLTNTHFSNPVGFDGPENYSTVRDLSNLGRYAYRNTFIRYVASLPDREIFSLRGTKYKLEATNILLKKDSRFRGLKTGHTDDAGYSFVGVAEAKNLYPVLIVVLNSPNRFQESVDLLNWVEQHYQW